MRKNSRLLLTLFALAICALLPLHPAFANATITIVNADGPGEGFNDPGPANPASTAGGNPGTTIGAQRLYAFQFAANIWGQLLDSKVPIVVLASFDPLTCTPTGATLGAAGAIQIFSNFPNAPVADTWYHVALANKIAGVDLAPAPGVNSEDIVAFFNSSLNGNPACLGGRGWYYGTDANEGTNIDLIAVLLHEFAHGLGFSNFVTEATGSNAGPPFLTDIYSTFTLDTSTGLHWDVMTNAQRQASAINVNRVVWDGDTVTAAVPSFLAFGTPSLTVDSPPAITGVYRVGAAAFGPALSAPGVTGNIILANDGVGPATDGCEPFTNAAAISNNIALIDRGGACGFTVKAAQAQAAGAKAVIIANNVAGSPPGLGGVDPTITIPTVSISLADGNTIKAQLGLGVHGNVGVNLAVRAGADANGFALLNAPNPVQPGSSISHWDPIASPNLLMEPAINANLTHTGDMTLAEFRDIGWYPDADLDMVPDGQDSCLGSNLAATVIIDGCNSGVPNALFGDGCTISDHIAQCAAGASNHGGFVSCVSHYTNTLKKDGTISGSQKGAIQSCASGANIP